MNNSFDDSTDDDVDIFYTCVACHKRTRIVYGVIACACGHPLPIIEVEPALNGERMMRNVGDN